MSQQTTYTCPDMIAYMYTKTQNEIHIKRQMWSQQNELEMWADAQRDGRHAEYKWHTL